ncbi:MAG: zinc-binding alcohol dehydrogenase family protein [Salinivirgaceae bacterium]|nr:zinc-binding alcohol dehydrogenase family protein [Salinivirgaceae bacterium]
MKAIEIQAPGNVAVVDVEKPTTKSGEVLLKLDYVGFCGSDLNTYRGGNAMVTFPRIPGHEIGATIVELGSDVPSQLKVGQTVTVNPYTNCGHCASCRRGRVNACENNETLGVQRNGAMQEFISLPWQKIIPCGSVSVRDAALIEPMSVGFHAVDRGRVTDTDTVMVIGCGMVGLGAVVRAVMRGATVIAADLDDEKLALARQLGATYTYNTATEWNLPTPDVVIEAVGAAPTYQLAVNRVAFTGRIVCIGYAKADISLTTSLFVKKELDIMGSRNANPSDFEAVIKYLTNSGAPVEKFISRIIEPQQSAEALKTWAEAPGKVFRILVKW